MAFLILSHWRINSQEKLGQRLRYVVQKYSSHDRHWDFSMSFSNNDYVRHVVTTVHMKKLFDCAICSCYVHGVKR